MRQAIYILILASLLISCSKDTEIVEQNGGPVTVGMCLGGEESKTAVNADGVSTSWTEGDRISVWAETSAGSYYFANQNFVLTANNTRRGFFSTTLNSAMTAGNYTYYVTYPNPKSVNGTTATFTLPSVQNGKAGNGADIMVATPMEYSELKPLPLIEDHSTMSMSINHMMHILRFYTPEGNTKMGGEAIERIEFTMTPNITGDINVNFKDPAVQPSIAANGGNSVKLNLAEKIQPSTSAKRNYAYAAICPLSSAAGSGSTISIKIYSESKIGTLDPINIAGRTFASGHATSIALNPKVVSNQCKMYFNITSNNLGENAQTVTISAPSGCTFPDGTNTYIYNPGTDITAGHAFSIVFEDESKYRTFSQKSVTVTYDSVHARVSETKTFANLASGYSCTTTLGIPYLLYENFSGVNSVSSDDAYTGGFSSGSKSGTEFMTGWSGARFGAQAGTSVRLACRRETSANYPARMDSKALGIKTATKIRVRFNYSGNRQEGGIGTKPKIGQTCYIGYTTESGKHESGDNDDITFADNSFYLNEDTGSYTNINHDADYTIENVPANARIVWRTENEHKAGTTNSTVWLYIDNIIVQIAK